MVAAPINIRIIVFMPQSSLNQASTAVAEGHGVLSRGAPGLERDASTFEFHLALSRLADRVCAAFLHPCGGFLLLTKLTTPREGF
jgi:hypothetical protein